MEKIITFTLAIFFIATLQANAENLKAYQCSTDSNCYAYHLQDWTHFLYHLNGKIYKINVPATRSEFNKLQWLYNAGELESTHKHYKACKINALLIKKWMEPLYY